MFGFASDGSLDDLFYLLVYSRLGPFIPNDLLL